MNMSSGWATTQSISSGHIYIYIGGMDELVEKAKSGNEELSIYMDRDRKTIDSELTEVDE